jgi:FMN phosphatase YigB (HAD superfamily)
MPAEAAGIPVIGTVRTRGLLVLASRLEGRDTFLTGTLRLDGRTPFAVRILTFDDVTVLHPTTETARTPPVGAVWEGVLVVSHGLREHEVPADLAEAAAGRHRDLTGLTGRELRYALTFLREATTPDIRARRVDAIVTALPPTPDRTGGFVVTVDVGGTLGAARQGGLVSRLIAASPLEAAQVRRAARDGVDRSVLTAPGAVFEPYAGALEVVQELSRHATVVTLSNVSYLEADLDHLRAVFAPWIVDHFPSCRTGHVKPDPRAFHHVAAQFGVDTTNLVHIGDDWDCDVQGALAAGARPIWVTRGRSTSVTGVPEAGGVLAVDDLSQVLDPVLTIMRSDQ